MSSYIIPCGYADLHGELLRDQLESGQVSTLDSLMLVCLFHCSVGIKRWRAFLSTQNLSRGHGGSKR